MSRAAYLLMSILLCLPLPFAVHSQEQATSHTLAIRGVTVIDVESGTEHPDQMVLVVNDRIEAVGDTGTLAVPALAAEIDGTNLFLMPGLFDAHVHYVDPETFGHLLVANGVTFVRDMGLPNELILPIRDDLNSGALFGPEMAATGYILDGTPALIPAVSIGLRTEEEARQVVREQAAAGIDMIKVYSRLRLSLLHAILDEAAAHGLKVVGHVPDATTIRMAAELGLASSEHFFGFDKLIGRLLGEPVRQSFFGMGADVAHFLRLDEVDPSELSHELDALRRAGLTVCPTIIVFERGTQGSLYRTGSFEHEEYVSQTLLDTWNDLWPIARDDPDFIWETWSELVTMLHETGISLMVGTDLSVPGIIPGFSVHQEMELWQEAGIPAADVLRSATLVPAQFVGVEDRLGTIEEGKTASMVLLRANPLEDIANASEIEGVFLRGEYFDRSALDGLLDKARGAAGG